ncbi:LuxR C-terminal-related transcriptional regulator [Actinomycetes bacterium KLBMP 9797]
MVSSDAPSSGVPLVVGKISVPPRRDGTVSRRRLTDVLGEGTPLVVVVASAGWGKTTLLTDWAHTVAGEGGPDVGWLTLDEADDEPSRFWTYLVSAVRVADGTLGGAALAALRVPEVDPLEAAVPTLLNDLATRPGRLTVVVDDLHVIRDRRIHEGLEFLLAYLPPGVRLVVAGRSDPPLPLARLRARGELTEIRAADLRFTAGEAGPLVAAVSRRDPQRNELPEDVVEEVVTRTEGWAAGLKLMALALRGVPGRPADVAGPADGDQHVVDYLTAEVVDGLPSEQRDFLLRTSVLDRLAGPLCDFVLERHDSARILAELDRADLFLVALDARRTWYRYHRLFREALLRELRGTRVSEEPALLLRAAWWHRSAGDLEGAFRCLVAAGDPVAAGELLADRDDDFLARGALGTFLRLADALPSEVVRASPRLGIALAAAAAFTGRLDRVAPLLDAVDSALTDDSAPPAGWHSARAAAATLRTVYVNSGEAAAQTLDLARRAVALESDPTRQGWVISRIALGSVLSGMDHDDEAAQLLGEAVGRADAVDLPAFSRLQACGLLAVSKFKGGKVEEVRRLLRTALPEAARVEDALGVAAAPAVVYLRLAEGFLLHLDGDVPGARAVLARAADLAVATGHPSQSVRALTARAEAELAGGDRRAAAAALSEADEIMRAEPVLPGVAAALRSARERIGRGAVALARRDGALAEPLTERELTILRALQGPLNRREIGAELYLSVNTIKGYTKSLYRKLAADSRPEAVRRGRQLGLI